MNASARLTTLTRIGFATRGALYIVIATLILRTGRAEDQAGALEYLGQGGGQVLLAIMAAGLLAYGIWRLADAAFDIERHGAGRKGTMERAGAGMSGLIHLLLAWQAIQLMRGAALSSNGTERGAEMALLLPGGSVLLIAAGLVLVIVAFAQLAKAVRGSFLRHLDPQVARQSWVQWSGRAGYAARGLVFLVSAYFLLKAAISEEAREAGGLAEVLSWLSSPIDIVIAVGLLGFGLFSLVEARYRVLQDVPLEATLRRAAATVSR